MKRIGVTVSILLAGTVAAGAATLPTGTYGGTAEWRGTNGIDGTYAVERTFSGTTIRSHYSWKQPQPREETHSMTLALKASDPFFDVLDDKNEVVGKGYCYDDACAYRATFGPVTVDETIRWQDGQVFVMGAKSGPGFSVVWKETLEAR